LHCELSIKANMKNITVLMAWIFAVTFLGITILGLISNFFAEEKAFFETNTTVNLVHLTTAIWFIVSTRTDESIRIQSMQIFGMTYMLISLIGFLGMNLQIGFQLSDVIYLNLLNYLQFGLGFTVSATGSILKKRQRLVVA